MKRARKRDDAVRATISTYTDAVLSKRGAILLRSGEATYLNDDEMDRLAGEWQAFRGVPDPEPDPGPIAIK